MSQKQVKMYARMIRRDKDKIITEFVKMVKGYKFMHRIKFAFAIIMAR